MFNSTPMRSCLRLLRGCLFSAMVLLIPDRTMAAPVSSVQVNVPFRSGGMQLQIRTVKMTLLVDMSMNTIQLSIAGPHGTRQTNAMDLTNSNMDCFMGNQCFVDFDVAGNGSADSLRIYKPKQIQDLTVNNTLVLEFTLLSNEDANCMKVPNFQADESWTVGVVGGATRITSIAVESLDQKTMTSCGTMLRPIPLNDGPVATVTSTVPPVPLPSVVLQSGRVGIDAVMVLDRSGSMASQVSNNDPTHKIVRLQTASKSFLDMWQAIRKNESDSGVESPKDSLGIIFFDHESNWIKDALAQIPNSPPTSMMDGLNDFATLNLNQEETAINAVPPRGSTAIGKGLLQAAPVLAPAASETNRKLILLMSDGMQNTPEWVWAWQNVSQVYAGQSSNTCPAPVPNQPPNTNCPPLPNQPPIQIYGVTVGTDSFVDPTVSQNVSNASNGFYLNTETDASNLPDLFLQVLQDGLRFSTIETLRVISDTTSPSAPFQTQVPVSSGTKSLAFNLTWNPRQGRMRVLFTPPGGGAPIEFNPTGPGTVTGGIPLPLPSGVNATGQWTIQIPTSGEGSTPVRFNFTLMGDDVVLNSALGVVRAEYAVGGKIKLTAQVNEIGKPIAGLNTQPNARVQAAIVRPGNNIGDVLSDSAIQGAPGGTPDPGSAAQHKLDALLAANPNALIRNSDLIALVDNGDAASGDDKAGDGIYSALIPAQFEGHYQIVFFVEGESKSGGRFVRQQIRTVHVRSLPDGGMTRFVTGVVGVGTAGQYLATTFTPRTVLGGKMGPGWANYFWLASPGSPPVKPVDNLDGTYTAQVPFAGASPPPVPLYFLPDPVFHPDDFVPQPVMLTSANQIIADVGSTLGAAGNLPWWAWVLLLGAAILLVLLLVLIPLVIALVLKLLSRP